MEIESIFFSANVISSHSLEILPEISFKDPMQNAMRKENT